MRILYKIGSGIWVVLNPANFKLGLFLIVFVIPISLITFGEIYYKNKAEEEFLHKEGGAKLEIDSASGLQIYKVGIDEPYESLRIQSVLKGQNFLLYAVPVSVVYESIVSDIGEVSYVGIFSAMVPNICIDSLARRFNERRNVIVDVSKKMHDNIYDDHAKAVQMMVNMGQDIPDFDMAVRNRMLKLPAGSNVTDENHKLVSQIPRVDDVFLESCGKNVFFERVENIGSVSTISAVPSLIIESCLNSGCSKCQIVEGYAATGQCVPTYTEVKNDSKVVTSNGDPWLSKGMKPVGSLPYAGK